MICGLPGTEGILGGGVQDDRKDETAENRPTTNQLDSGDLGPIESATFNSRK